MPSVRQPDADPVRLVLTSDWHISARPPVARSSEPDWWAAMARPLVQVRELVHRHDCPLVIAGDVFDRWDAPPEAINFLLDHLPQETYAVPGQHDLPHHRYGDVGRSAYGTLVKAGAVRSLLPGDPLVARGAMLHGFPWGTPLSPCPERHLLDDTLHVAVVHRYCWRDGRSHPGVRQEDHVSIHRHSLKGFDLAVFGDNHKGFLSWKVGKKAHRLPILNCGGLLRRKSDERDYRPSVGLLRASGAVERRFLDSSSDLFAEAPERIMTGGIDAAEFLAELDRLGDSVLDFHEAVLRALGSMGASPGVRSAVLEAIGE